MLMITVVLCIVVVCMRRYHRERDHKVAYNTITLNTDVTIEDNPSYDVIKADTLDHSYSLINPGGSDVPININPSYNVPTKPYIVKQMKMITTVHNLMSLFNIQS